MHSLETEKDRGLFTAEELAPLMERFLRASYAVARARRLQESPRPRNCRFNPYGWSNAGKSKKHGKGRAA